jgi:glycosyltransferase involved in cell wall biosynthesis
VLARLATLLEATDLYTIEHDPFFTHAPGIEALEIHTSSLQRLPGASTFALRAYLPFYPWAVGSLKVEPRFDLLLSTSSSMIKAIRAPEDENGKRIPHICYCHNPPRYLWTMSDQYAVGAGGLIRRAGLALTRPALRRYDRKTCNRVDRFIANSTYTARRIKECYNRESDVVFPPVDVDFFTPDSSVKRGDHYLVASALEPYKRIDLAIHAIQASGTHLRIAGTGSQFRYLCSTTAGRTTFLGQLDRESLRNEFRSARALLFPGIEDFGIAPVEALACGCPVIARNAGGALDWMTPECGLTFNEATPESLGEAIVEFERRIDSFDPAMCRKNALRFAPGVFDSAINRIVGDTVASQSG